MGLCLVSSSFRSLSSSFFLPVRTKMMCKRFLMGAPWGMTGLFSWELRCHMSSYHSMVWKPQWKNAAHMCESLCVCLCGEKIFPPVDGSLELTCVQSARRQMYAAVINHTRTHTHIVARIFFVYSVYSLMTCEQISRKCNRDNDTVGKELSS